MPSSYTFLQQSTIGRLYIGMFHFLNVMCYRRIYAVHLRVGTCSNLCLLFLCYYELCTPIFGFDFNMMFLCLFYVGINAAKTKGKGKGNGDPFTTRFLVHRICDHEFSQDQIGWIEEASFGALLAMSEFSIPVKLVAWIMKHIDVDLREFRLKHKVVLFDKQLVCNILGVPSREEPVKLTSIADQYEAF